MMLIFLFVFCLRERKRSGCVLAVEKVGSVRGGN